MPKTYSVKSVNHFNPIQFVMDGDAVIGFTVNVELNMGSYGMTQQLDIWDWMPPAMRQAIQQFHDKLKEGLENYYLRGE